MEMPSHKRHKLSPGKDSPPPKPCPFQNLPRQIPERCVGELDPNDLYSLTSNSRIFYKTFRTRAVLGQLEDAVARGGTSRWPESGKLFCLADATSPDDFGWAPFFMMLDDNSICAANDEDEYRGPSLSLSAIAPNLLHFEKDSPTPNYLIVR